jgi:hypothetical protein
MTKVRDLLTGRNIVFGKEIGIDFKEGDCAKIYYWGMWCKDGTGYRSRLSEIGVLVFHNDIPINHVGSIGVKFPNGEIVWEDFKNFTVVSGEYELEYYGEPNGDWIASRWKE